MRKTCFVFHGKFKGSREVQRITETFSSGYEVSFLFTEHAGHAIDLARQAALQGNNYIIAAGGDGTNNEVANGIMLSGVTGVKMGLLPYGTGNDFAKTLGLTNNHTILKELIEKESFRQIDLGEVAFKDEQGKDAMRYFINIADVGLGGHIARKIAGSTKWLGAFVTFQKAIVTTFLTYKHQQLKATADSFTYQGRVLSYIIANGKYFGAGLGIAPGADPGDGEFEVVLGAEISLWDYLMNLGKVRKCEKIIHPQMSYHRVRHVQIDAPEPMPIDMDGEFIGYTPMNVSVVPGALSFICPQQ